MPDVRQIQRPPVVDGPLRVHVPGSKSFSLRALTLGAIAEAPTRLRGLLQADDTAALLQAMEVFGVTVSREGDDVIVHGGGPRCTQPVMVNARLGGAPARFATALGSLADVPVVVDGALRLRERPMDDVVSLFEQLGVRVVPVGDGPGLPLRMEGGAWETHRLSVGAMATSQVLSSLLLIAPRAGGLHVDLLRPATSEPYLWLTIDMLRDRGVDVHTHVRDGVLDRIDVPAGAISGGLVHVPADASAAFAAAVCACMVQNEVHLPGVSLQDTQPDTAALHVLREAGLPMVQHIDGLNICATGPLAFDDEIEASGFPDAVPSLAVCIAARASGPVRLTGLHTLRVKECDRVDATACLLREAGGVVQVEGDDLLVQPLVTDCPATAMRVDPRHDHRMAMAAAALGMWRGAVEIDDAAVVNKSWPGFWDDLAPLGGWTTNA